MAWILSWYSWIFNRFNLTSWRLFNFYTLPLFPPPYLFCKRTCVFGITIEYFHPSIVTQYMTIGRNGWFDDFLHCECINKPLSISIPQWILQEDNCHHPYHSNLISVLVLTSTLISSFYPNPYLRPNPNPNPRLNLHPPPLSLSISIVALYTLARSLVCLAPYDFYIGMLVDCCCPRSNCHQ